MTGISTSNRRAGSPSLNVELGHPIKTKEDAETEAEKIRTQIREGTFIRAAERRQQAAAPVADTTEAVTLDVFAKRYIDRHASVSGKTTWKMTSTCSTN
jgi:Flp pilus assembly protein TadD